MDSTPKALIAISLPLASSGGFCLNWYKKLQESPGLGCIRSWENLNSHVFKRRLIFF